MYYALLVLGCFFASTSAIFVKLSVGIPSSVLVIYRLFFACVLTLPYIVLKHRREYALIPKKMLALSALSGLVFAVHLVTFFESLAHTGVAEANILLCTEIVFIAVYEKFVHHHNLSLKGWLALAVALGAAYVVITGKVGMAQNTTGGNPMLGNFFALVAALTSALYTIIGREVRKEVSMPVYTFNLYVVALLGCLSFALAKGTPLFGYARVNIATAFGLAVCANLLGHNMFSLCLKHIHAHFVGAMKLTNAIFGSLLAFFILGEVPSLQVVLGSVVLLGAIAVYFVVEKDNAKQNEEDLAKADV